MNKYSLKLTSGPAVCVDHNLSLMEALIAFSRCAYSAPHMEVEILDHEGTTIAAYRAGKPV